MNDPRGVVARIEAAVEELKNLLDEAEDNGYDVSIVKNSWEKSLTVRVHEPVLERTIK